MEDIVNTLVNIFSILGASSLFASLFPRVGMSIKIIKFLWTLVDLLACNFKNAKNKENGNGHNY